MKFYQKFKDLLCLIGLEQRGLNWLGPLVGVDLTAKVFGGGLLG